MSKKTCVVTGADTGIGRRVVEMLAERGHEVVPVCLRESNARELGARENVHPEVCDLSDLEQVRSLAARIRDEHDAIHALANVAGIVTSSYAETGDGFERQLAVNHLAPYLLTRELLPLLEAGAPSRVVIVASRAHRYIRLNKADPNMKASYNGLFAYRHTKLLNVLFAQDLARRMADRGVSVVSLHPGVTRSNIGTANTRGWMNVGARVLQLFARPTDAAAREIVELSVGDASRAPNGAYFRKSRRMAPAAHAQLAEDQQWAWEFSASSVGLPP